MRQRSAFVLILLCAFALAGCGRDLAGTYRPDVRLQQGQRESTEPGYTLAEVRAKLQAEPRAIILRSDKRYEMRSADFVEMGKWRARGDTLFLRGEESNGVHVQLALQEDRTFRVNTLGQLIDDASYGHYNLELVYERK